MAEFVTWKPYFSVGNESLDTEHKIIFGLINDLYAAVVSNKPDVDLKSISDRLVRYTMTHFQHEEQAMSEWGYPDLHAHRQMHESLRQRTVDLCSHLSLVTARDMLRFLKDWWCEHIQERDKAYSPYVRLLSRSAQ
jgi:hemerythrin-like metal-binding protein